MTFFDVVKQRHSIRAYSEATVPEDKLNRVLEAANAAPSAGNLQAYEIYVVTNARQRSALASAAHDQFFVAGAPVVLVFCAHAARAAQRYGRRGERLYAVQDATIACTFAMLAATAEGLATVWVGAFNDEATGLAIGTPPGVVPVAVLPLGYANERPDLPGRRGLDDLVHRLR